MELQIKAFALLFTLLFAVDAAAYHGHYRSDISHKVAGVFGATYGPGSPGHKPVQTR